MAQEITIKRDEFLEILNRARWTISRNQVVPLLSCFCFKDGLLFGYNGVSGVATKCDLGGLEFAVPADLFYRVMSNLFEEITLRLTEKRLRITSGSNSTLIGTYPIVGYPDIIPKTMTKYCMADNLCEAFKQVGFTAGTDALRPQLLGVSLSGYYIYSSDGSRITRIKLNSGVSSPLAVPNSLVDYVAKFGQPDYMFTAGGLAGVLYSTHKTTYIVNSYQPDFPVSTVDNILEKTVSITEVSPEVLKALKRVRLLSGDTAEENDVIVSHDGAECLTLKSASAGIGEALETIHWPFKHQFKLAINPRLLEEGLERTLKVDFSDVIDGDSRHLRFVGEDGFDHLVGLMHLKE